jgi:hypothetical protein
MSPDHPRKAKKRWLRKAAVKHRYGDISDRALARAVDDGRIPQPQHPLSNKIPFWDEDELDANDARAAMRAPAA